VNYRREPADRQSCRKGGWACRPEKSTHPSGNDLVRANQASGRPLTAAWAALGGKWKLIIIYWLADAPPHFAGLRRLIPDIYAKVRAEQLRELVADGVVDCRATGPAPDPVIYSLSDIGQRYGRTGRRSVGVWNVERSDCARIRECPLPGLS
jgi:DNA-binding HxlR family transcriptional regulator